MHVHETVDRMLSAGAKHVDGISKNLENLSPKLTWPSQGIFVLTEHD